MIGSHLPNLITSLRILLVVPVGWALLNENYGVAVMIFLLASVSDGLDGYLARHYGWQSRLGAVLDPIADKALLVTVYLMLGWNSFLPWWLVVLVVGRDLIIVSGALAYRALSGRFEMDPTFLSKLNTLLQLALALAAIFALGLKWLSPWSVQVLIDAVAATTVLSGLHYVTIWTPRAWRQRKRQE